jgi:hypothetical protein
VQKGDLRLSITDQISDGKGNAGDMDMDIPVIGNTKEIL